MLAGMGGGVSTVKFVKADINAHKQCQTLSAYQKKNRNKNKFLSHQITTFPTGKLNFARNMFVKRIRYISNCATNTSRKFVLSNAGKNFSNLFCIPFVQAIVLLFIRFQDGEKNFRFNSWNISNVFYSCLSIRMNQFGVWSSLFSATLQVFKFFSLLRYGTMSVAHHFGVSFM